MIFLIRPTIGRTGPRAFFWLIAHLVGALLFTMATILAVFMGFKAAGDIARYLPTEAHAKDIIRVLSAVIVLSMVTLLVTSLRGANENLAKVRSRRAKS